MSQKSSPRKNPLQDSITPKNDHDCSAIVNDDATDRTVGLDKTATNSKAGSSQSPEKKVVGEKSDSKSEGNNNKGQQQTLKTRSSETKQDAPPLNNGPAKKTKFTFEDALELLDEAESDVRDQQELEYEKIDKAKTFLSTLEARIEELNDREEDIQEQHEILEEKAAELQKSLNDLAHWIRYEYGGN